MGDRVLSGSVDVNGAITMRADKVSRESQYAKIVALVKKAQEEKAPIQRLADRYAIFFTPLTLVMALIWIFDHAGVYDGSCGSCGSDSLPFDLGYAARGHLRDQPSV